MNNFKIEIRGSEEFYRTYFILSEHSQKDISTAYSKAVKKTRIDFIDEIASEYDYPSISIEDMDILAEFKIDTSDIEIDERSLFGYVTADQYIRMLLQFIKLGNSKIKFEILPQDIIPSLKLGSRKNFGQGLSD
ncbi:MAG: hypothetical protein PHY47_01025 [Lachnospiraceae bacterium]|nr:hypothetical protein [Lachnospiraceae bacterium]